ncbi:Major facilitator superfamily transporter [Cordyceps militaris CM01]|uniref:Major facilitator superfamily transporter n=1 Tax=Cordyceps militaris (strain CM01) TaxID=983644 RepID=G3J8L1_CORMM|nr:Major facilitator superfamily transporter [Cordyceps militaris CM01]EGX94798.1 Major facilitator superfamily transporter [Cordyceps militaris CM01]
MAHPDDLELDETATRLLTPDEAEAAAAADAASPDDPWPTRRRRQRRRAAWWQVRSPRSIVLVVALSKFCIVCSGMMLLVPLFRLVEDAICHGVLADTSPDVLDERRCKDDGVQARLATFLGWSGLVGSLVTLVTAFPFGAMSDRFGRKPTALLAYLGLFASFFFTPVLLGPPLRQRVRDNPYLLLWGNLFQAAGGGIPVLLQTLYAVVADVSTEEEKCAPPPRPQSHGLGRDEKSSFADSSCPCRAANFLYISLGSATGGLLGPLLAGVLMTRFGPWVPIWIVISISPLLISVLLLLPETLKVKTGSAAAATPASDFRAHMARGLDDLRASLRILRNRNVALVLVTFLTQNARMTAYASTLVQYVSKHYGWTLGQTSVLLSPVGVLALVVLGGLPRLAARLVARGRRTVFATDLLLTRASTALLVAGALVQGLAPNVAVFVLGLAVSTLSSADSPLARATVSHHVDAAFTSRLYALIGVAEVLGSFVGAPVLAYFFNVGLLRKGLYTGLPYFYVALLSSLALLALMFVRSPPRKPVSGEATPVSGEEVPGEGAIRL